MNSALLGALIGSAIGLVGAAVGTYFSIRNTNSPLERSFMIKLAVGTWILVTIFVAAMLLISSPYKHLLWLPYSIMLVVGIKAANKKQLEFRKDNSDA